MHDVNIGLDLTILLQFVGIVCQNDGKAASGTLMRTVFPYYISLLADQIRPIRKVKPII